MSFDSFHTQHSPFGSFASFTLGLVGSPGGFGHALKGPAKQNVYAGYRRGNGLWRLLPFFEPPKSIASAFTGEASPDETEQKPTMEAIRPDQYVRRLGAASDRWQFEGCSLTLFTPYSKVSQPESLSEAEARLCLAPVVYAELAMDNSEGTEAVELIFGLAEQAEQLYPINEYSTELAGFAGAGRFGFATKAAAGVGMKQGFSVFYPSPEDHRGLHVLGTEVALVVSVPAGQKRSVPIALGFYEGGQITTGIATRYAYTQWFSSLEAVLVQGLENYDEALRIAEARDQELQASALNEDQKFLIAQAVHSYYGSTQLLLNGSDYLWVVNEGEYRMINTFDLTVDHLFFELAWHPWAVRNTLDLFVKRYSYRDRIRNTEGQEAEGGVSFTHDMGVANHFTQPGYSSYECDALHGCFSHMTMEQLLNWILTACTYAWKSEDWSWLEANKALLLECASSLENRDDPVDECRNGLPKWDSSRVNGGSEITTYDSLDVSLGQARNNLYLAGKALGAWILLQRSFVRLGVSDGVSRAQRAVARVRAGLCAQFNTQAGFFPAVFEKGNRSHIIPAVEGLAYPLYLGFTEEIDACSDLLVKYALHLKNAFVRGVCLDAASGAWKMSSTSRNTWFSKIALSQYVVRSLFPDTLSAEAKAADAVHAHWQRQPGCGAFAMCDQIFSDTGVTCGSRYYPRGVTTWLWLSENGTVQNNTGL